VGTDPAEGSRRSRFATFRAPVDCLADGAERRAGAFAANPGACVTDASPPPPILPIHIEETIRSIARLHAEHHGAATPQQRLVDRIADRLGRPGAIGALVVAVAGWIAVNAAALALGHAAPDPPPFAWLNVALSLVSLFIVVLILGAQRHEEQLAQQRELLTLELAILGEQKIAKVIQLLEEVRRDNPLIHDRVDPEAEVMAQPADPQSVLDAIKETHAAVAAEVRAQQERGPA
jgi:uncharacterized membrane protein